MKNSAFAVAALSLVLSACAAPGGGVGSMSGITPELIADRICSFPRFKCIKIVIVGAQIQDPGKTTFQGRNHVIVWTLPQNFTFPDDGITITTTSPGDEFTCGVASQRDFFFCFNRHTVGSMDDPREYKYTIKVNGISPLDPHVVNN